MTALSHGQRRSVSRTLRTLFEMGGCARFVLDHRQRVLKSNAAARRLFAFAGEGRRDLPSLMQELRHLLGERTGGSDWTRQICVLEDLIAARSGFMTLRGQARAIDLGLHPIDADLLILELGERMQVLSPRAAPSNDLALLCEMLEYVEEGVIVYDLDREGREVVRNFNRAAVRILELPPGSLHIGMTRQDVARTAFLNGLESGFSDIDVHVNHMLSGQERQFVVRMPSGARGLLINRPRTEGGSITICTDVTQRREDRQKLRESAIEYQALAESAPTGIVKIDEEGRILFANPAAESLFDSAGDEIDLSAHLKPGDGRSVMAHLRESRRFEAEIDAPYHPKHVIVSVSEAIESDQARLRIVTFADVTALKEARRRIEFLARHDAMTGLGNRALLQSIWARIEAMPRATQATTHFVALDLDRFKKVNDDYGHANGDQLLKLAANRILFELPDKAQAFRLGGDEFGILLHEGDKKDAIETAERIVSALSHPFEIEGAYVTIGCSAGVASLHADARNGESVQRAADVALYKVKRNGRDGVAGYEAALEHEIIERRRLETDLALAVAHDELQLLFQPELDVRTGDLVGLEAIVRWHNRRLGTDVPGAMIHEIALACGLASVIDFWAVRSVLAQITHFDAKGFEIGRVSLNVSPSTLVQPNVAARLGEALRQAGVQPGRLELEVELSSDCIDRQAIAQSLEALGEAGIAIAFDKVGRKHRLLEHINARRIQRLKLDASFAHGIDTDGSTRTMVGALMRMCDEMGLGITLCGVDDEKTLAAARRLGARHAKGTMVAAAENAEALALRFAANAPQWFPRHGLRAAG